MCAEMLYEGMMPDLNEEEHIDAFHLQVRPEATLCEEVEVGEAPV